MRICRLKFCFEIPSFFIPFTCSLKSESCKIHWENAKKKSGIMKSGLDAMPLFLLLQSTDSFWLILPMCACSSSPSKVRAFSTSVRRSRANFNGWQRRRSPFKIAVPSARRGGAGVRRYHQMACFAGALSYAAAAAG